MSRWPLRTLEERFWSKVDRRGPAECWIWRAHIDRYGYGQFGVDLPGKRLESAHRVSYQIAHHLPPPPVSSGLNIDHLCRNHACVNPTHLELVTIWENTLRGNALTARNARKTRCPRGHTYDVVHGRARKNRRCLLCSNAAQKERRRGAARIV